MQAEYRQNLKAQIVLAVMALGLCARVEAADALATGDSGLSTSIWNDFSESAAGWKNQPDSGQTSSRINPASAPGSQARLDPTRAKDAKGVSTQLTEDAVGTESGSIELQGVLRRVAMATGGLGLAAVIGLWFFRSWLTQRRQTKKTVQGLEILESLRIGPRLGLYLIQADRHRVLVGIDQGRTMQMLTLPSSFADSLHEATAAGDAESDEPAAAQKPVESETSVLRQARRFWQSGVA
jgi:flagellar biogenesis protein FliO